MISVVIPSYKNREMLVRNLTHNIQYLSKHEVIIVNDDPAQSIAADVRGFPTVTLIENGQNIGFAASVNKGVRASENNYVMVLNSDVLLNDNSYEKSLKMFERNKKLFAVSFAQSEKDGTIVGRNILFWKNGIMQHSAVAELKTAPNGWAEGGSMMVDKTKFQILRGFSHIFAPFYWEDIDLSYRAWKSGYDILFEPTITVVHHHESTIGKYFDTNSVRMVAYRNQFLFVWKTVTEKKYIISHVAELPKMIVNAIIRRDIPLIVGFFRAIVRLPAALKERQAARKSYVRSDTDVLNILDENRI